MSQTPAPGSIGWVDLTVPDAAHIRDFYAKVTGWEPQSVEMGGYKDFTMIAPTGDAVAGICHARGVNAGLPAQWLVYIVVENLDASLEHVLTLGGKVLALPRGSPGQGRICVIQDPAGAVAALYEAAD
jgi:uncharacterized protein